MGNGFILPPSPFPPPLSLLVDRLRVEGAVGENGAHADLAEEGFEVSLEAVERARQLARVARRVDLLAEAFERLPVLVHQVTLAAFAKGAQSFKHARRGRLVPVGRGAGDEHDELPQLAPQFKRLFELGCERTEERPAVDAGLKALREHDNRLLITVAQKSRRVL